MKYSDTALHHFIIMFQGKSLTDDVKDHVHLGFQIEGKKYIEELKNDLNLMFKNRDIQRYCDLSVEFGNPLVESDFKDFLVEIEKVLE